MTDGFGDDGRPLGSLTAAIIARAQRLRAWAHLDAQRRLHAADEVATRAARLLLVRPEPTDVLVGRTDRDLQRATAAAAEVLRDIAVLDGAEYPNTEKN